ncbi:hypothetical protein AB5J72_41485 [Streptomyces sp. CG1]|uniref:hypothetical protein n=1 Tax=Streptomyces sp. CG1 TaxID=1287523 RepID=UPI0034E24BA3
MQMQPSAIRDRVYHRCEFKEREATLYPDLDHPRTINLREDIVYRELDTWISWAFAPDRLTATITALSHASIAASTTQIHTPDPAIVTQWINDAQRDEEAAPKKLDSFPAHIAQRIQGADTDKKEPLYEALGITIIYDNATKTATVRSRPSIRYR